MTEHCAHSYLPYCLAVGVDPGVTTGLATVAWSHDDSTFSIVSQLEVDSRLHGEYRASILIADYISAAHTCHESIQTSIVVEDFVLRRREMDRSLLSPIRMTMLIATSISSHPNHTFIPGPHPMPGKPFPFSHYLCSNCESTLPVLVQQPSIGKTTFTDDRLRTYSLYRRGERHARDAVRHAATHLLRSHTSTG